VVTESLTARGHGRLRQPFAVDEAEYVTQHDRHLPASGATANVRSCCEANYGHVVDIAH
jgi:hypothetical protein